MLVPAIVYDILLSFEFLPVEDALTSEATIALLKEFAYSHLCRCDRDLLRSFTRANSVHPAEFYTVRIAVGRNIEETRFDRVRNEDK